MSTLQLPDQWGHGLAPSSAVGGVSLLLGTRAFSGKHQLSLCSLPNATNGFSFKEKREKKRVPVLLRRRRGVTGEPFSMRVRSTNHVCTSWSNGTVCETCISFDSFSTLLCVR